MDDHFWVIIDIVDVAVEKECNPFERSLNIDSSKTDFMDF